MLNLNSLLVYSEHPKKLGEFYTKVFGKKPVWNEGDFAGWDVGSGFLTVGLHDKVKGANSNPERFMFNLETEDVVGEFARIKALGAKVVAEPYHPDDVHDLWIATFADPDGNYFQLVTPWKGGK